MTSGTMQDSWLHILRSWKIISIDAKDISIGKWVDSHYGMIPDLRWDDVAGLEDGHKWSMLKIS